MQPPGLLSQLRKLPREQWILALSILVNRVGTMALPFLVLFLTRARGLTVGQAGFILGVYGLVSIVIAPLGGWLCDRVGAGRVSVVSLFLTSGVLFLFPLVGSFSGLLLMTALWACVAEVIRPATMTLASEHAPPELRKLAFAVTRLAINLGMSVGPAVGGFLAEVSFESLFLVDAVTTLLGGIVVLKFLPLPSGVGAQGELPFTLIAGALRDRKLCFFLLALVPVGMVFSQHESTLPLYLVQSLGFRESFYGTLFVVNAGLIVLVELWVNAATSHWPARWLLPLGCVLFGLGFGAMAFAQTSWAIVGTVILWTFGEMVLFPAAAEYVSSISPRGRKGGYMGIYTMAFGVCSVLGPWTGVWILQHAGPTVLWPVVFAWALVSAFLLARVERNQFAVASLADLKKNAKDSEERYSGC